ncbi:hypothetical protein QEN19_002543 [Hanseniaspora menglaensis]
MALGTHNSTVLLKRAFSLKETTPLVLVLDTLLQTATSSILSEFKQNNKALNVIYVGFDNVNNKPAYSDFLVKGFAFIDTKGKTFETKYGKLIQLVNGKCDATKHNLIIMDNINYIENEFILDFINSLSSVQNYDLANSREELVNNKTLLTVYHKDNVDYEKFQEVSNASFENSLFPNTLQLLTASANIMLDINPVITDNKFVDDEEDVDNNLSKFHIPRGFNNKTNYQLELTHKRKSGRVTTFKFIVDSEKHEYIDDTKVIKVENPFGNNDISEFDGMTTFNLKSTDKQKKAKENVELPFMEAQQFTSGGAIVYEFEKDDDYDEEDPFEDPF